MSHQRAFLELGTTFLTFVPEGQLPRALYKALLLFCTLIQPLNFLKILAQYIIKLRLVYFFILKFRMLVVWLSYPLSLIKFFQQ